MAESRQVKFQSFDPTAPVSMARRLLPHWRQTRTAYFVTFRLADSVPQTLLRQWRDERTIWLKWHPQPWLERERHEYKERFSVRMQECLDAGMGGCHLRRADVRREVVRCLLHFDGTRYHIDSFVVMPNHVHILLAPSAGYDLSKLMRGIKGVSARSCNRLTGRKGKFWMDESYDHIVRDPNELMAFRDYISQNPTKAGLKRHQYSLEMRNVLIV